MTHDKAFPHCESVSEENALTQQLTPRQQMILEAITTITSQRGYPPTIREIGDVVGLTSTSSVSHQLKALESKGLIVRDAGRPRAVNVSSPDSEAFPPVSSSQVSIRELPLLGNIAAGMPISAIESHDELIGVPEELLDNGSYFMLKVRGDSMVDAAICDGDWVIIKQQNTALNGDIVAAIIGDEATVKTFHKGKDGVVWLLPQNSSYPPINGNEASIVGIVTGLMRKF